MAILPHEIVIVKTERERQQCFDVRIAVFHIEVFEQKFPVETEFDEFEFEDIATHFLLRLTPSLVPIGTIRAYKYPGQDHYRLTRLAVLQEYRKFRFGRALVLALHEWVKADALRHGRSEDTQVICHSLLPVKKFYAKFGYRSEGAEFDEDGYHYQPMVLRLPLQHM